jgi:hypothetical protein
MAKLDRRRLQLANEVSDAATRILKEGKTQTHREEWYS